MAETVDTSDKQDPLIGTTLGGYKIIGILGRGGYAVVYRALQVQLNREVALKVLTGPRTRPSPSRWRRFSRKPALLRR